MAIIGLILKRILIFNFMDRQGYISLWRQFLDWGWYSDMNCKALFIHCLLRANIEEAEFKGIKIERGSFFTSIKHLSIELSLSEKQIRIAIDKLCKTGEISIKGANKGTYITVCKYNDYQFTKESKGRTKGEQGANKGRQINNKEKNINYYLCEKSQTFDETYKDFVDWLLGKNEINKPFDYILNMDDPIGYERFVQLVQIASENGTKIMDKVRSIENKKEKKYTSFNLTLTNWLKKKDYVR